MNSGLNSGMTRKGSQMTNQSNESDNNIEDDGKY